MSDVLFPRTRHLAWLGAAPPRDDKLMSEADAHALLQGDVTFEEKVDGANVGLFVREDGEVHARNRGTWLAPGGHPQFGPLWGWIAARTTALCTQLGTDLVLFGEWVFAVHSVHYDALPDWFLAFDVYSRREARFWCVARRDTLLAELDVVAVPRIEIPKSERSIASLRRQVDELPSRLGAPRAEGLYVRRDDDSHLIERAKLVRSDFLTPDETHWSKRALQRNRLATG